MHTYQEHAHKCTSVHTHKCQRCHQHPSCQSADPDDIMRARVLSITQGSDGLGWLGRLYKRPWQLGTHKGDCSEIKQTHKAFYFQHPHPSRHPLRDALSLNPVLKARAGLFYLRFFFWSYLSKYSRVSTTRQQSIHQKP